MNIKLKYLASETSVLFCKFAKLSFMRQYTFVGGTALAVQIEHQQSEDLDFVSDGEKIPDTAIKREIAKRFTNYRLLREEKGYQLDFIIEGVKVTFFSTGAVCIPFKIKDYFEKFENVNIATVEIIAVLKMATISQRNTICDYYDLYYIARHHLSLKKIIEKSKKMLPNISPITYAETIIYTRDIPEESIENHLNPAENVTKEQIGAYFIEELRKMRES